MIQNPPAGWQIVLVAAYSPALSATRWVVRLKDSLAHFQFLHLVIVTVVARLSMFRLAPS